MAHLVRPPLQTVLSAFSYHVVTRERWVHDRDPRWYARMGLWPPLPAGGSFASHLRGLDRTTGVLLQAQHSRRLLAAMVAVAEACAAAGPPRCYNFGLEAFMSDFEATARAFVLALGVGASAADRLVRAVQAAAQLTDEKRQSSHVTRGKHSSREDELLIAALHASTLGPPLRRLEERLRAASDNGGPRSPARPGIACRAASFLPVEGSSTVGSAAGPAANLGSEDRKDAVPLMRGWWSSLENTERALLNTSLATRRYEGMEACCALCRAATNPGCLFFNWRGETKGETAASRCVLLTSRHEFHAARHAVTGEA